MNRKRRLKPDCAFFKGELRVFLLNLIDFHVIQSCRLNPDLSRDDDDEMGTLCQCALKVVKDFLPETKLTPILSQLLTQERADTLSK